MFFKRQVLLKVAPGAMIVPSGMVTSEMNWARSQGLGGGGGEVLLSVKAFTTQVGSLPPASENSSGNEPPLTVTLNVLTAKPPTAVSTSANMVVPLAFTTILSWA